MGPVCFISTCTCGQLSPVCLVLMSVSSMLSLKGIILIRGATPLPGLHTYICIWTHKSSLCHDHHIMGELLGSYRATF